MMNWAKAMSEHKLCTGYPQFINGPGADCASGPLVSELPAEWGLGGAKGLNKPRFLHSGMS
jgi:hypothetical protein